jgi:peroxiredoxin
MKHVLHFSIIMVSFMFVFGNAQPAKEQKAPNFSLKTENGKLIELSKLKGKAVVVNFWATWCGPCRAEIPDFIKVYNTYKSKGLEIIGISLDEDGWTKVKPFIDKNNMNYPVVLGDMKVVRDYGNPEAIPTTFFIDKKGNIIDQQVGMLTKKMLEQRIQKLLQ